jgi:hypothetical protein
MKPRRQRVHPAATMSPASPTSLRPVQTSPRTDLCTPINLDTSTMLSTTATPTAVGYDSEVYFNDMSWAPWAASKAATPDANHGQTGDT